MSDIVERLTREANISWRHPTDNRLFHEAATTIATLRKAGQRLKQIHDDLAGRLERGESTDDAFDLWDEAMDAMEAALQGNSTEK